MESPKDFRARARDANSSVAQKQEFLGVKLGGKVQAELQLLAGKERIERARKEAVVRNTVTLLVVSVYVILVCSVVLVAMLSHNPVEKTIVDVLEKVAPFVTLVLGYYFGSRTQG